MIKKEQCLPGTRCIVNSKMTNWNVLYSTSYNGLVCHVFDEEGLTINGRCELIPGSVIEIIDQPKRYNGGGAQVKFKIEDSETVMSAWWSCFKPKIDIL
jgi:hypothetical protein